VKNRFTLYPHFLHEPESADAFAARHAGFGSATASRVRCGIDDAQSRPSDFAESNATPGSDGIFFAANRASVLPA
jgi:hypothetical protein